ncbi:MAG: hypothetical protein LBQ52_04845 [Helicobacteraceae bacterium]|jgi:hypothetical protein|nr:hypothetical protein [Helicobacteraceae bacterium]
MKYELRENSRDRRVYYVHDIGLLVIEDGLADRMICEGYTTTQTSNGTYVQLPKNYIRVSANINITDVELLNMWRRLKERTENESK